MRILLPALLGLVSGASAVVTPDAQQPVPGSGTGTRSAEAGARPLGGAAGRGLGSVIAGPFDLQVAAGDYLIQGADQGWGFYWAAGSNPTGPPRIYQFDLDGNLVGQYDQVTISPTGAQGMEVDEKALELYAGAEHGELVTYAFDKMSGTLSWSRTEFWAVSPTIRGLAKDPESGFFYVADGFRDILEVDPTTGSVLQAFPNPGSDVRGAAWDHFANTLWLSGRDPDPMGGIPLHLHEFTVAGGVLSATGREFWGEAGFGGEAAGLGFANDARNPSRSTLVAVHMGPGPAGIDRLAAYSSDSGLSLTLSGSCPGPVTVTVTGATPNSQVALIWGPVGSFTVPPPFPCAGTQLDVIPGNPPPGFVYITTDATGMGSITFSLGPGACNLNSDLAIQALDTTTCEMSSAAWNWDVPPGGVECLMSPANVDGDLKIRNEGPSSIEVRRYQGNTLVETRCLDANESLEMCVPEGHRVEAHASVQLGSSGSCEFRST